MMPDFTGLFVLLAILFTAVFVLAAALVCSLFGWSFRTTVEVMIATGVVASAVCKMIAGD